MADFTREELAEWRKDAEARANSYPHATHEPVTFADLLRLLSMAERAVSQETVRKLAEFDAAPLSGPVTLRVANDFALLAARDLRPAAARLAEGKGG